MCTEKTEGNRDLCDDAPVLSLPGCRYRLLPLFKDSVYPVGLGEQCGIAETHSQAQENPPERAHSNIRRGNHQECDGVAKEDSRQQHVAHLPPRGANDRRVIVADEGGDDEGGGDDAQNGDEDGQQRPGRVPLQLDDGDGLAAGAVPVGPLLVGAELAGELAGLEVVPLAALAVPAARDPLHHLLPLAGPTGQAAHGGGQGGVAGGPLQVLHLRGGARLG